jgi:acetyltransferase-like isoleucine patch superfamily enzyme
MEITTEIFRRELNSGKTVVCGSEVHQYMHRLSQEALRITAELNGSYHEPEEVRSLFSQLIGQPVDDSFTLFPPFSTDCGKNIHVGKRVFFNSGCKFQDHGGITIGDGALIGHHVVMATLNHSEDPERRGNLRPAPIHIGKNVWIGSNATILPGVTIGDGAIVGAGAVVTRDVPENMIVVGVPARVLRPVKREG